MKKVIGVMPLWLYICPEENFYGLFSGIRSFLFVMMKIAGESFRYLLILFRNNP